MISNNNNEIYKSMYIYTNKDKSIYIYTNNEKEMDRSMYIYTNNKRVKTLVKRVRGFTREDLRKGARSNPEVWASILRQEEGREGEEIEIEEGREGEEEEEIEIEGRATTVEKVCCDLVVMM